MRVISPKRAPISAGYEQWNDIAIENFTFFLMFELSLLGPAALLCVVIAQPWPLYLMVIIQALGAMLGVIRFTNPADGFLSCIPLIYSRRIRREPTPTNWKKTA